MVEIEGINRGFISFAGPLSGDGVLLAEGQATYVRVGEREWS